MLRDGASWPTINMPGNPGPSYAQQAVGYPGDVISHMNRSQQQHYMQQQQAQVAQRGIGPSPAKRARHGPPGHAHGSATAIPPPAMPPNGAYDDEDGTSGGDYMDFLTPRDISLHRYVQHHEWLEEILNSPFDTSQIIPGELGMGRKGELESLTKDFFDAPINTTPKESFQNPEPSQLPVEDTPTPRVGKMDSGRVQEFTKQAADRVAQINAEMEKLRRQHARRMAKLNKGRVFKEAEENIRASTIDINGDASKAGIEQHRVDEIVAQMEAYAGKTVKPVPEVECIQKGGLEEKSQAKDTSDQDYDMIDNFGQFDGPAASGPTFPEPLNQELTNPTISVNDTSQNTQSPRVPSEPAPDMNNNLVGANESPKNKVAGTEDWIMVNKEGNSTAEEDQDQDHDLGEFDTFTNDAAMQSSMEDPNANDASGGDDMNAFDEGAEGDDTAGNFDSNEFGDGIDFGDLDTAGEELAGYGQEMGDAGLEEHGDIGASDTAFGDAFPDTEAGDAQRELTPSA